MKSDPLRDSFEEMDEEELLATAAFFENEYGDQAIDVLKNVCEERGITEATIRDHREKCHPDLELAMRCESCGSDVSVDRGIFVGGKYACSECGFRGAVVYQELAPDPSAFEKLKNVMFAGGVLGELRDRKKRVARREGIIDGSYWNKLKNIR